MTGVGFDFPKENEDYCFKIKIQWSEVTLKFCNRF